MATTRATRPTIHPGPASHYAGPGEVIVEFSDGQSGGLISIRRKNDGNLWVEIYRTDRDVIVLAPRGQSAQEREREATQQRPGVIDDLTAVDTEPSPFQVAGVLSAEDAAAGRFHPHIDPHTGETLKQEPPLRATTQR